jgi:DNA modification methylase
MATSNPTWQILEGHVLDVLPTLPAGWFHCCVTSPPYWGLRNYGVEGQLGLEQSLDEFIENMVAVFREVKRALRDDGTLWLNMGDSYSTDTKWGGSSSNKNEAKQGYAARFIKTKSGCKPKDLCGVPWMLAFALRADGWFLRSDVIWHKKAPMPESVYDRPTKAHEYVFLLTKKARYFYDAIAGAEPVTGGAHARGDGVNPKAASIDAGNHRGRPKQNESFSAAVNELVDSRNARTVWSLSPESFSGAHFATMPTELVRRALLAGTSEKGCCPTCGKPMVRELEKVRVATRPGTDTKIRVPSGWNTGEGNHNTIDGYYDNGQAPAAEKLGKAVTSAVHHSPEVVGNRDPYRHVTTKNTIGWKPGCECNAKPVPCRVLDPFSGAGTTAMVARRLGLHATGIELNPEYAAMSRKRIIDDAPLLNGVA